MEMALVDSSPIRSFRKRGNEFLVVSPLDLAMTLAAPLKVVGSAGLSLPLWQMFGNY